MLGVPLIEEVGRLFEDWHFTRSLNSEQLGAESQLAVAAMEPQHFNWWAHKEMGTYIGRARSERERFGLACEWCWSAIHAGEPVMQFLSMWFAVEVVAMPDTTNVRPVRERLAASIGGDQEDWSEFVGRLYGKPSRLAHGNEPRQVNERELADLRLLVEVLLQAEMGEPQATRCDELRTRAGVS